MHFDRPRCGFGGVVLLTLWLVVPPSAVAEEKLDPALRERITAAVARGLPLVEKAAARYPEHRKCFSCHHQTLPMLAVVAARSSSLPADAGVLDGMIPEIA